MVVDPPARVTARRRPRRAGSALGLLVGAVLLGGCSDGPTPGGAPAASATPAPGPTTSGSPAPSSARSQPAASSTSPAASASEPGATPTATPSRSPHDTVGRATPRQVSGLVQVVASIGPDRSETSTGMVLTSDGEVVTSDHGVVGATAITATVQSSGRTYTARLVAEDASRDVALLRLSDASGLAAVELAPRTASVGDRVVAVGHAGGSTSTFTAATGAVLATDQTLVAAATATTRAERLTGLLLSSGEAFPGMSGGPTYDARGRVVGMTTAAVSTGAGLDSVAIPVGRLRAVVVALAARAG